MTNNLVARLRAVDHMSVEDCFLQSYLFAYAADALEGALAESWRPIEDAPHGVEVLLATPPFECMGDQAKWEFRVGCASCGERICRRRS